MVKGGNFETDGPVGNKPPTETGFAAIFANLAEGVAMHEVIVDKAGAPVDYRFLEVNPGYEKLTGLPRAKVVGHLASAVFAASPPPGLEAFVAVTRTQAPAQVDLDILGPGSRLSVLAVPTGPRWFATIAATPGVPREQADTVEKSRLALRALLDNQPHLAWLKDRDCRFLAVNKAFAQACGQPNPDAIVGKTDLDVWPRKLAEAYRADDQAVMASGKQKMVEEPIAEVDGTRWFETYKSPVFDHEGTIVGTTGIARDITQRKLDEIALREAERAAARSRARLLSVSELAHIGHYTLHLQTGTLEWTRECYRIFGQDPDAFRPTPENIRPLIHPEDLVLADQAVAKVQQSREAQRFHFRGVRPNGDIRHCLAIVETEEDPSRVPNTIFGMIQDLTELRRAEEERRKLEQQVMQAQKLESLGVLAGGIAHDFNNLLTSILGNADLAHNELSPSSPAQTYLEDIEQVSRRAAELCRQMLAYSGKGRFVVQAISLNDVVREMGHLLSVSINKNAALTYAFHPDLPSVMADATQIRQVVMNLITNAAEAIGNEGGLITLTTGVMECDAEYLRGTLGDTDPRPPGKYAFLEVTDSGCGMDRETLKKIFDPFFTTKFTGRGLGLAAVLGIVRGHKGVLQVYSEPGKGTAFKILLPIHNGMPSTQGTNVPTRENWRGSGTILLADDEKHIRAMGRRLLERAGFSVLLAADGHEAVTVFEENRAAIRLVILDMTMPRLDGEACYRELRLRDPKVKVIMTSGYNEQEVVNRFIGKGLSGFVQKPYKALELLDSIRAILAPDADQEKPPTGWAGR